MAAAGYLVELLFGVLGLIPTSHTVGAITQGVRFNYTSALNLVFLVLAAILVGCFLRTGGPAMLRMMSKPEPAAEAGHHHHGEAHAGH